MYHCGSWMARAHKQYFSHQDSILSYTTVDPNILSRALPSDESCIRVQDHEKRALARWTFVFRCLKHECTVGWPKTQISGKTYKFDTSQCLKQTESFIAETAKGCDMDTLSNEKAASPLGKH